jgi:isocitrate lyase
LGHVKEVLPTMSSSGLDAEEQQFQDEVAAIKQWWSEPRWRFTKRPFTAEQIANKRGNLPIQHPGNALSKKLWNIVEKRFAVSTVFRCKKLQSSYM